MKKLPLILLLIAPILIHAQSKKSLDHSDYDLWRRTTKELISNDGKLVAYSTKPNGYGNEAVQLHSVGGSTLLAYERGSDPGFSNDSRHLVFKVSPDFEAYRNLQRIKTKKKDLPPDTLAIYSVEQKSLDKVAGLKSYKIPKEWDDYLVYLYDPVIDSANKKEKKRGKKSGFDLVVKNLSNGSEATFPYVLDYAIAKEGAAIALITTGNDSTTLPGVYTFNFQQNTFEPVFRSKGTYFQLAWDNAGKQLTFISDTDTTKVIERDYQLHYFKTEWDSSRAIVTNDQLDNLMINKDFATNFSEAGKRLFFETKEFPVVQDTSILKDEIVNVEVWNTKDQRLFTQQENNLMNDQKFGYLCYYDTDGGQVIELGGADYSDVLVSDRGDGGNGIALDDYKYRKLVSWEGYVLQDIYDLNLSTGEKTKVAEGVRGNVQLSPLGKYAYWYNHLDTAWFAYDFTAGQVRQLTSNAISKFYNERHDSPSEPWPYGLMSWTEDDDRMLVYDRYDIWELDPTGAAAPRRTTTDGRENRLTYRYVKLGHEERFITKGQNLMLTGFYEADKQEAVFKMKYGQSKVTKLMEGSYQFNAFKKARDTGQLIYTKENFQTFPDLHTADLSLKKSTQISEINPQQKDYKWGTIELVYWNSLEGERLEGLLVKPEGFDPKKKYPLMVNFYEKSSDGLHNHRDPFPHRSTMNYAYYASRGYVIFNPNVHYGTGYPGEDAYNCVIPGVTSLIEKGFIDAENIGVQGHSWGGYQIAHILGETDIFKCAEAGAPVVNMISAYGGIRWGSGLSRMFQYEHTQSRIGGSLWEYPLRYIENSPIFTVDKVTTPVLIMHNDEDGAVPWYQGIEYFVALRRLGKPAWMLNYRGEPHWPLKIQNRIDFNIRMSQFFDFYLKGAAKPKWMRDGVPAMELGVNQGYELLEEE